MGFTNMAEFIGDDIATDYSALMSQGRRQRQPPGEVPAQRAGASRKRKSQIDEYLEFYGGAGCQHIALATNDILRTVDALRANGVEFLDDPGLLLRRPGAARPDRQGAGADRGAEVARRSWSTATRTATCCRSSPSRCGDRPTVFFELIERHGSLGFGKGNFKALFEAIEREQERRGNL